MARTTRSQTGREFLVAAWFRKFNEEKEKMIPVNAKRISISA